SRHARLSSLCNHNLSAFFRPRQQAFCCHRTFPDTPPSSTDRARIPQPKPPKNGGHLLAERLAPESSSSAAFGSSLFTGRKCCGIVDSVWQFLTISRKR